MCVCVCVCVCVYRVDPSGELELVEALLAMDPKLQRATALSTLTRGHCHARVGNRTHSTGSGNGIHPNGTHSTGSGNGIHSVGISF